MNKPQKQQTIQYDFIENSDVGIPIIVDHQEEKGTLQLRQQEYKQQFYIYNSSSHQSTPLKHNSLCIKESPDKNRENAIILLIFTYHDDHFYTALIHPLQQIFLNKKVMIKLEEHCLELGDVIEIGSCRYIIVDQPELSESEANSYIGKRIIHHSFKAKKEHYENLQREFKELQNLYIQKCNQLKDSIQKYQYYLELKRKQEQIHNELQKFEKENLTYTISNLEQEIPPLKEELYKKKSACEELEKQLTKASPNSKNER